MGCDFKNVPKWTPNWKSIFPNHFHDQNMNNQWKYTWTKDGSFEVSIKTCEIVFERSGKQNVGGQNGTDTIWSPLLLMGHIKASQVIQINLQWWYCIMHVNALWTEFHNFQEYKQVISPSTHSLIFTELLPFLYFALSFEHNFTILDTRI